MKSTLVVSGTLRKVDASIEANESSSNSPKPLSNDAAFSASTCASTAATSVAFRSAASPRQIPAAQKKPSPNAANATPVVRNFPSRNASRQLPTRFLSSRDSLKVDQSGVVATNRGRDATLLCSARSFSSASNQSCANDSLAAAVVSSEASLIFCARSAASFSCVIAVGPFASEKRKTRIRRARSASLSTETRLSSRISTGAKSNFNDFF